MPSITKTKEHLHITLPASLKEVDNALPPIMQFLKESSLNGNLFVYNYIIREGLNNAVIHGSGRDSSKTITLDLQLSQQSLDICIEDEGQGFNWQPILDRQLVSPEACNGRGIFCMSKLHFQTSFNSKGNILYLHKDLTSVHNKEGE
jgi:serine/threonine-protein kinase RsbW